MRLLLIALCVLEVSAVRADKETKSAVRMHYDSGISHYNLQEYRDALADFKAAYRLKPDPAFLFNIAQCQRQLADFASAAASYRAYKREVPESPHRAEVERLIGEMDKAVQDQRLRQPPTGTEAPKPEPQSTTTTPGVVAAVTESPAPRSDKPLVKKPWFWVTVVGGAAVVATVIGVSVAFGSRAPEATLGRIEGN
jgi:hypothetical protein